MMDASGPHEAVEQRDAWVGSFAATPHDLWTRGNVGEVIPNAITPLTLTFFQKTGMVLVYPEIETLFDLLRLPHLQVMRLIRGRVYFNLGGIAWLQTEALGLPDWIAAIRLRAMGGAQELILSLVAGKRFRPGEFLAKLPGLVKALRVIGFTNLSLARFEREISEFRVAIDAARALDLTGMRDKELWAQAELLIEQLRPIYKYVYLSAYAISLFCVLEALLARWLGEDGRALANDLVSGVSGTKEQEAAATLWRTARIARGEPAAVAILGGDPAEICPSLLACQEARQTAATLRGFFAEFGHRGPDEWEMMTPRWRDDPAPVGAMLSAYAAAPEDASPDALVAAQTVRRAEAERTLRNHLGRVKAAIARRIAARARDFMPMRQNPKYYWLAVYAEERRVMLEAGRRLAARAALGRPDDAFFLTFEEVHNAVLGTATDLAALRTSAERRRAQQQADQSLPPLQVVAASEVEAIERGEKQAAGDEKNDGADRSPLADGADAELKGIPVSRGVVTGRARIVLRPEEGHDLRPGDILVAPFTDPSWTPLFAVVSGIVMDLGGTLSHGSILAREYGIPAVVNVSDATRLLRDGHMITIDGARGIVKAAAQGIALPNGVAKAEEEGRKKADEKPQPSSSIRHAPSSISGPLILPLDSGDATLELAGGKGASLARMAAAGLPVPGGFHITTAAYRRFVVENDLLESILSALRIVPDDLAELECASSQIRALLVKGAISDEIASSIRCAYHGLNPLPASSGAREGESHGDVDECLAVAVRSSATAEDLPGMSFAGQQESYLNVRGDAALLDAVRRCWASLWTARAIAYRNRHGIAPEVVSLAVVVQELAPAEAAGVMFTANPLTGDRGHVLINAGWGLGEAIVGGLVTPDALEVDKASGAIVEQQIADKAVMTVRTADSTRVDPVPDDRRHAAVLDPDQAAALASIGVQIERLYGGPMDIEWAIRGREIFILQARPITALPDPSPSP